MLWLLQLTDIYVIFCNTLYLLGKSVYLKQVALIVFLAHLGSYVPAESASIGFTDAIYARLSSIESVSISQSAFSIDCAQISKMIHFSTRRSLLLIDEFGKGTVETNGVALLGATILNFLSRVPEQSPVVLVATHFYHLLSETYLPMTNPRLCTYSMEVLVANASDAETETQSGVGVKDREIGQKEHKKVVFLYKLSRGSVCVESQAWQCALQSKIPRQVVRRSLAIREAVLSGKTVPTQDNEHMNAKLFAWEQTVKLFLEADLDTVDLSRILLTI